MQGILIDSKAIEEVLEEHITERIEEGGLSSIKQENLELIYNIMEVIEIEKQKMREKE